MVGVIVGTAALGLIVSLFGDRYECSPEEVQTACDELSNISNNTLQAINEEIGKNVTIVNNAAYGYIDISNMNAYAPAVQDSITNLMGVLDKQAQIIEEYNNGSLVEKMLGTGTMAILNLTEGVLKFGEDIVDAGANIIAGVGTLCGFDMEEVELWAAKDLIGGVFDDAFENGPYNWVEKYSIYSHESTAAEILKGVGTAIPYIALAATGVGLVAEAGIAGAAGFGRGSTNYQQQHLAYDANGVASFDDTYSTGSMMWEGAKQGAFDAATVVIMDKGIKAIGNKISSLKAGKAAAETKALTTTGPTAVTGPVTGPAPGPVIVDSPIPAGAPRTNAIDVLKNASAKARSVAKGIVTDTAAFVKANPKTALIGGGIIAGEKALGNMKTSYIPTNYASAEVQELSKVGGGENRIVIDEIDDLPEPTPPEPTPPEPTTPKPTPPEPTTPKPTPPAPTTPKPTPPAPTTPEPTPPKPTTPEPTTPEPTPGDNVNTEVSNPPSKNNQGSSGVNHGGIYNNSGNNNNWNSGSTENNETELNPELNPELEPELPIEEPELPEDPIEEESIYTIPSNLSGVKENNKKTSSGSGVLPILGGLGAAAAVGVGAKMYLDNKKNNENGDDEDYSEENDDLLADEWNGEDTEFNYEDPSGNNIAEPDDDLGEM